MQHPIRIDGYEPVIGSACVLTAGGAAQFGPGVSGWYRDSTGALVADVNGTDVLTVSSGGGLSSANVKFGVSRTSSQAISDSVYTAISFSQIDTNPQSVAYWAGGSPSRITNTSSSTKYWLVTYTVFANGSGGGGIYVSFLAKNGAIGSGDPRFATVQGAASTTWNCGASLIAMAPNDYLQLWVYQNSGLTANSGGAAYGQQIAVTLYELP